MVTKVFKALFVFGLPVAVVALNLFFEVNSVASVEALSEHSLLFCPFHALTDLLCPGCGMTRSLIAFFSFQMSLAWHFNPFGVPFGFGLIGLWYQATFNLNWRLQYSIYQASPYLLTVVLVWGVYRNL